MKIVYVIHKYTNVGGTDRILSVKANYLVEHGYDVTIISLENGNKKPFFFFDPRIQFYHLDIKDKSWRYANDFKRRVKDIFEEIHPDIAISMGVGQLPILLSKVEYNCKKILEFHFSKYRRHYKFAAWDKYKWGRMVNNIIYYKLNKIARTYDKLVILTHEDSESWTAVPQRTVICNPASIDTKTVSPLTTKRIVTIGRHAKQKGFDYLVDIWSKVEKDYPDWILTIYGSGRREKELRKKIQKLNLENRIELKSPTMDIESVFADSAFYVMTSRHEGFPLVLTEAISSGLPAVAYACKCGPSDIIIDGEDGFLIKFLDERQFIEKMKLLLDDEELRKRMGRAGYINSRRFKVEKIMPQWESLFAELIND